MFLLKKLRIRKKQDREIAEFIAHFKRTIDEMVDEGVILETPPDLDDIGEK